MNQASLLTRAAALCAALMLAVLCPPALAQRGERTPVDLPTTTNPSGDVGGGGGGIVRTIVGLAVVIGVIYGIAWVLRQLKQGRQDAATGGLSSVASVPLGSGKALHLVRAGNELLLVGVADHGVTPVRTYTEDEAREAGLIDEWGELVLPDAAPDAAPAARAARSPKDVVETMRKWTVRR